MTVKEWWDIAPWQRMDTAPLHQKLLLKGLPMTENSIDSLNYEYERDLYLGWLPLQEVY